MKKLFAFMAATVIAFSFASCNENGPDNPDNKDFKITIDSITVTGAYVLVEPTDTAVTYYWDIVEAEEAAKLTTDTAIGAYFNDYFEQAIAYYKMMFGVTYTIEDFLSQGKDDYTFSSLAPETDYVVIAIKMDAEGAISGSAVKKEFKTLPIPAPTGEKVNLGELECTYIDDYRNEDGSYIIYFENETTELALNFFDDDFNGTFMFADIDPEYSYIYTEDAGELLLQDVTVAAVLSTNGKTSAFAGSVIAYDGIEYEFTSVADLETLLADDSEGVPAKKMAKASVALNGLKKIIRK